MSNCMKSHDSVVNYTLFKKKNLYFCALEFSGWLKLPSLHQISVSDTHSVLASDTRNTPHCMALCNYTLPRFHLLLMCALFL